VAANIAAPAKQAAEKAFYFQRLDIGPRLTICFLFIIVAMLVGNAVLLWQFHLVPVEAERLRGVDQELIAVLQAHTRLMSVYERLEELADTRDTARLLKEAEAIRDSLLEDSRNTRNALDRLPAAAPANPALLPTLETSQGGLRAQFEAIIDLARAEEWDAVHLRLANEVRPLESRLSGLAENIDREVGQERAQAVLAIAQAQRRILLIVPLTAVLMLLFAALLGAAITRSITQPLGKLVEASKALGRGEFQHRVSVSGNHELAQLGRVFNDTAKTLRDLYDTLHRKEAYLAEAQRLSHTGSFGWRVSSGEIYWSEETSRIFEVAPEIQPTLDVVMARIHPDDRQFVQQSFETAAQELRAIDFEHRILLADGSTKYVRAVGHPSTDNGSANLEFVGAVTDITERKHAEEELKKIVDFVPQVLVVLDADGKWIHANRVARDYTGLTHDDYRLLDVIDRVIHPGDVETMRAVCDRALSGKDRFELEARLLGKDGAYRWFLFRYNPLAEEGHVRRWYASATEIESRKQEEERVRNENVRLEERTRIAQELHDTLLQTFISASMQLSVAVNGVPPDAPFKPQLDRIFQIMNQGINEGRITIQGLRSFDSERLELIPALSRIQHEVAAAHDIDFRVIVVGRPKPLQPLIQDEIYRIGREALINAFFHSQAQRIELELEYTDSDLRMRIRDNGCGIDPQVLDRGRQGHWGLAGMRERAVRSGGSLKISSAASAGTDVELSIPSSVAFQISVADQYCPDPDA
jgi:PAS domain S-box-containing protein